VRQYEAIINAQPTLLPPYMLLGILYTTQADYQTANAYFQRALELNPKFALAANNLAWNYAEHGGNIDIALSLAQTAKEQLPDDPHITDTLGWIYYKKGAYRQAIAQLEESIARLPDDSVVHYHLGMAYYKKGDATRAKQALQQALRLYPDFPGAQEARDVLASLQ
jgi:tetratricopeptide (TPR) repeat protein